jgi:ferritin-like metal-binding protein YciE
MQTMNELFLTLLQDVYYAEKQLLKTLPKLAKHSANEKLAEAFEKHHDETQHHLERLDQVFDMIGKKARGKKCDAILGIIAEGEEVIEDGEDEAVCDAGILAAAQAAEHYEIARYGTLIEWATTMGQRDAVKLLQETLDEEKHADQLLTQIAQQEVNRTAMHTQEHAAE